MYGTDGVCAILGWTVWIVVINCKINKIEMIDTTNSSSFLKRLPVFWLEYRLDPLSVCGCRKCYCPFHDVLH